MLSANTRTKRTSNVGERVTQAVRRGMMDAADAGFAVSQDEVPKDRGTLMQSGHPPEWTDNRLVWQYSADHARPVEEGTAAHYPPINPLKGWARRVLGDEGAAYAIQEKIGQEGTDAQPYVAPGFEAMVHELQNRGLTPYVDAEL